MACDKYTPQGTRPQGHGLLTLAPCLICGASQAEHSDVAQRLAEVKRLVAEGQVEIGNDAAKQGNNAVVVKKGYVPGVLVFQWHRESVGFGELMLKAKGDGTLVIDAEGMSDEFCLNVIRQAFLAGEHR